MGEPGKMHLTAETASDAASLMNWLLTHGHAASSAPAEGTMGASETVALAATGVAGLRAALMLVREWIKANRKKIAVDIPDVGRVEAEGAADIEQLLELLREREAKR